MQSKHTQHHEQNASNTNEPEPTNNTWYTTYGTAIHLYASLHYKTTIYQADDYIILQLDDAEPALTIDRHRHDHPNPTLVPPSERETLTITNDSPSSAAPTLNSITNETRNRNPSPYDILEAGPMPRGNHTVPDDVKLGIPTHTDTSVIIPNIQPIDTTSEITARIENTIIESTPTCVICAMNEWEAHGACDHGEVAPDEPVLALNADAETLQGFYSGGTFCEHHAGLLDPNTSCDDCKHPVEAPESITHTATVTANEATEIVMDAYTYTVESVTPQQ